MKPIIYNADYLLNQDIMDFSIPVEIHVTRFFNNPYPQFLIKNKPNNSVVSLGSYKNNNCLKVFLDSNEPKVCYMKELEEDIIKISSFYDIILTSNENILKNVKNSKLFLLFNALFLF